MEWIKAACSNDGSPSSARVINLGGFIVASIVILITRDSAMFTAYLGYCAGTYGVGKYFDTKATNVSS